MELICNVQNYEWGAKGSNSLVGKLAKANMNIDICEDKPYAEFWMGTHPNGPSCLKKNKDPLFLHIEENPEELGKETLKNFGERLPFLFKVLSVNKALSIQVHPSKAEAKYLNSKRPDIYKDSNYKPELAVALTQFRVLCSFRPLGEIKFYLKNIPEFEMVIQTRKIEDLFDCDVNDLRRVSYYMRLCFSNLMRAPESVVKSAVDSLINRLKKSSEIVANQQLFDLVMKLNDEFPGDVGIFCIYWLNYITLNPGEAVYIAPDEPHAYLSGDCVECMANSDNVIRAALTPKFRDITVLCNVLTCNNYLPSKIKMKAVQEDEFSQLFAPKVKDFAVAHIIVPANREYTLKKRSSASILVVIGGKGTIKSGYTIACGSVFYLPCNEEFYVKSEETVTIFQAFCNV